MVDLTKFGEALLNSQRTQNSLLTAYSWLLLALVQKAAEGDPHFGDKARAMFDTHLGMLHEGNPASPEMLSAARQHFQVILQRAAPKQAHQTEGVPKSKSLRRRVFEWLERG